MHSFPSLVGNKTKMTVNFRIIETKTVVYCMKQKENIELLNIDISLNNKNKKMNDVVSDLQCS